MSGLGGSKKEVLRAQVREQFGMWLTRRSYKSSWLDKGDSRVSAVSRISIGQYGFRAHRDKLADLDIFLRAAI